VAAIGVPPLNGYSKAKAETAAVRIPTHQWQGNEFYFINFP